MKKTNLIQDISRWVLTAASIFTMVMLPVAQGQAAQTEANLISKAQVQSALTDLGLNKSMTLGQFYKKNKNLYPPRIRTQIEGFIQANKDYVMPTFEVTTVKNSDGIDTPTVRISKDGELVNLQVSGASEKYVKFNNSNLTEIDIINFKDMFIKLNNGDANLRKQVEKSNLKTAQFEGFPSITKETWVSMTPEQRAGYVLNMRLMWNDAREILFQLEKNKKIKKTSTIDKFEQFFKFLIRDTNAAKTVADAQRIQPTLKTSNVNLKSAVIVPTKPKTGARAKLPEARTPVKTKVASGYAAGKECLIAGYVTVYTTSVCDHSQIKGSYQGSELYKKAASQCSDGKIACNPLVFGTPNGQPICIKPDRTRNGDFQIATHFEGPCERNNHLGSKVQFLKDSKKHVGRYDEDNITLDSDKIKAQLKADQGEGLQATKSFIEGVLKFGSPDLTDAFIKGQIDDKLLGKLLEIKNDFNEEIRQAKGACIKASNENAQQETNFWDACDQLQRRQIFVAEYLSKNPGCKEGSLNPDTLKCGCPGSQVEVNPGAKCAVDESKVVTGKCPAGMSEDSTGGILQCLCANGVSGNWTLEQTKEKGFDAIKACQSTVVGTDPKPIPMNPGDTCDGTIIKSPTGAETCLSNKPTRPKPEKKEENWFSGFFQKALPWLVGGLALFAMYKLWSPKKPALNSAGDYCPNGSRPPCGQICTAPFSNVNGTCMCAACPPGQTITNLQTCLCATATSTTTLATCPDGVTQVATLSLCPATAAFTCWDNSIVSAAINCPEKPPTVSPKTTPTGK